MSEGHNVQQTTIPGDQITSHVTDCQPVTHGQSNTVGHRSQNTHAHTPPGPALVFVLLVACLWPQNHHGKCHSVKTREVRHSDTSELFNWLECIRLENPHIQDLLWLLHFQTVLYD